jgi:hypothetical protein
MAQWIYARNDNKVRELASRGSSGQKPRYGLMTLAYQRFIAVLLEIYGRLFLSGVYYCLSASAFKAKGLIPGPLPEERRICPN